MTDQPSLSSRVYALSHRAFELAQDVARDGPSETARTESLELRDGLDGLSREIEGQTDMSLRSALSEATVDINYVLCDGNAPLSLRLAQVSPPSARPSDDTPVD